MPAVSEKQRVAAAIAEHEPEKLYARNRGMLTLSKGQLHDFASKKKPRTMGEHMRRKVMGR